MNKQKTLIIDYGIGNISSIKNAIFFNVGKVVISSKTKEIENATHIILPGVGSFPEAVKKLEKKNLIESIQSANKKGAYILGICLGMQLLFTDSEEFIKCKGLNLLKGKIKKMKSNLKLPNIGWRNCNIKEKASNIKILKNITNRDNFYFIHSYVLTEYSKKIFIETSTYGNTKFPSVFQSENIYGCQFHPEKSREAGLKIIKNFISLK